MNRPRTRLKVCCIQSEAEAHLAIEFGADALGLVASMPTGPGPIPDALIAAIAKTVPPPVATFLLTCRTRAADVIEHLRETGCNTIQLCDTLREGHYNDIRQAFPAVRIVQVIHVQDDLSFEEAVSAAPHVDALLLDSGRTRQPGPPELGGTGRVHNWDISRRIVTSVAVPVFLAGGLRADNIQEAVRFVRPFGVDLCNGVRTAGKLDRLKLQEFTEALAHA